MLESPVGRRCCAGFRPPLTGLGVSRLDPPPLPVPGARLSQRRRAHRLPGILGRCRPSGVAGRRPALAVGSRRRVDAELGLDGEFVASQVPQGPLAPLSQERRREAMAVRRDLPPGRSPTAFGCTYVRRVTTITSRPRSTVMQTGDEPTRLSCTSPTDGARRPTVARPRGRSPTPTDQLRSSDAVYGSEHKSCRARRSSTARSG
jgi:hypothetical protein